MQFSCINFLGLIHTKEEQEVSEKSKIRQVFLRKRKFLKPGELKRRSATLLDLFKSSFDLSKYNYVHVFLPIEKQNEVNTWPVVDYLESKKKQVVLSKSDLTSNRMVHYLLDRSVGIVTNKWGIPEPSGGQLVTEEQLDLVFVPLLVFDRQGNRIGYGKGYYDHFLSKCRPDCIKVGLSLSPPVDNLPGIEPTDIKLDYCISPTGLYTFGVLEK